MPSYIWYHDQRDKSHFLCIVSDVLNTNSLECYLYPSNIRCPFLFFKSFLQLWIISSLKHFRRKILHPAGICKSVNGFEIFFFAKHTVQVNISSYINRYYKFLSMQKCKHKHTFLRGYSTNNQDHSRGISPSSGPHCPSVHPGDFYNGWRNLYIQVTCSCASVTRTWLGSITPFNYIEAAKTKLPFLYFM